MHRLGHRIDGQWLRYSHPPVFRTLQTSKGANRLIATVPDSDVLIFRELASLLSAPLTLLYVLHTPRGEGEAGRYQSGDISHAGLSAFLNEFESLLETDGRYDLWVHSSTDLATIVWDRHDLVHVYGVADEAETRLRQLGFEQGIPIVDFEHEHHYRKENDELATQLLATMSWTVSRLRPEDEQ